MKFKVRTRMGYVKSVTYSKNGKQITRIGFTPNENEAWCFNEDTIFIAEALLGFLSDKDIPEACYTEARYYPKHLGYYLSQGAPLVHLRPTGIEYTIKLTESVAKAHCYRAKHLELPLPVEWEEKAVDKVEPLGDFLAVHRCR